MLVFLWIAGSVVAAWVAHDKGRNGPMFFLLALVASPLIGLLAAIGCRAREGMGGYGWSINRAFSKHMQVFLAIALTVFVFAWIAQ